MNNRVLKIIFVGMLILSVVWIGCGQQRARQYVQMLRSPDRQARLDASYKLILLGKRAAEPLMEAVQSGPDTVQYIAVQLLGKIGDVRALPLLAGLVKEEKAPFIRKEAAEALGKLGDRRAVAPLVWALKNDPVDRVRAVAATGLGNLRYDAAIRPLTKALDDSTAAVRKEVFLALVKFQAKELVSLSVWVLGDEDESIRYIAAQVLGRLGTQETVEPLIGALYDNSMWVRAEAATALGKIGDQRAEEPLIDLLSFYYDGPDGKAAKEALLAITGIEFVVRK